MERKDALKEVKRMKESADPTAYLASLSAKTFKKSDDLPVKLDESHAALNETRALLSESNLNSAKMAVAISVSQDAQRVEGLLKAGKLTIPVANKLVALCESKRADQIVRLADGDMEAAADSGSDIDAIMDMLGELPASVATETPAAGAPVPEGAPVAPDAPMDMEAQLDALAKQIAAEQGITYTEALMIAQAQLMQPQADPAMAGAPAPAPGIPAGVM